MVNLLIQLHLWHHHTVLITSILSLQYGSLCLFSYVLRLHIVFDVLSSLISSNLSLGIYGDCSYIISCLAVDGF